MKILSTVKYKIALASTALFISASSFAAEGATGGTDYAGQAMDALLTQANDLIGKVWPVVVAVVGAGLAIRSNNCQTESKYAYNNQFNAACFVISTHPFDPLLLFKIRTIKNVQCR